MTTINQHLARHAENRSEEIALWFGDQRLTYAELHHQVRVLAEFLVGRGIKPGDRVGVFMPNSALNVVAFLATTLVGAIEVSLAPSIGITKITAMLRDARVSHLIFADVSEELCGALVSASPFLTEVIGPSRPAELPAASPFVPLPSLHDAEPARIWSGHETPRRAALIQYTSGSTGVPKGVVLCQENFIAATMYRADTLSLDSNLRVLNVLPLFHSCSKSLLVDTLVLGGTTILAHGFSPPAKFRKLLVDGRPTLISGPPIIHQHLLRMTRNAQFVEDSREWLSVAEVAMSKAPLQLFKDLRSAFPWIRLVNRYGLTENAGAASLSVFVPGSSDLKIGSIGHLDSLPNIELKPPSASDFDEHRHRGVELKEIHLRSRQVMLGYWPECEASEGAESGIRNFATGDLAYLDDDGFVYSLGRDDDVVKVFGEKVPLVEVENAIRELPGIADVAVIATDDPSLGKKVCAFFVSNEGVDGPLADEASVRRHCHEHLSPHMRPRVYTRLESLPRTPSEKVDKGALRRELEEPGSNE